MAPETIRRIEVRLGSVLCALLTLCRRFADALRGHRAPDPPRRIVFLKLIEQGATVLACDAVRAAGERVGRENVYFCVFAENRFILDLLDLVPADNVICIRGDRFGRFAVDALRALARIRAARIDTVIDLEFFSRATAILSFLSGASRRVGLHRFSAEGPYCGDLLTHRVQHNPYLHVARVYRLLVDALWADPADLPLLKVAPPPPAPLPAFVPSADERQVVRATLETAVGGPLAGPLVLLNANCGDMLPLRRWPEGRFIELGRRLLAQRPDVTLALTGAPAERTAIDALCAQLGPRAVSLAGRTTLREALVLYTLADVLVTNDSGPGHFASLTEVDSIVLFGPETPLLFGPLGPRSQAVSAQLACSPCLSAYNHRFSPCRFNACMHAIAVDDVLERVLVALARRARHEPAAPWPRERAL